MNKKYDIHKGDRFCSLVVANEEPIKIEKWGAIRTAFECECECGGKIVVTGYDLLKGRIKSCGCKKGNPKSPYGTWKCEVCGSIFRSRKTLQEHRMVCMKNYIEHLPRLRDKCDLSSKEKGDLTEQRISLRLQELGFTVLKPLGDKNRYDFVVDLCGRFIRIQCKTSHLNKDKNSISFSCRSMTVRNGKQKMRAYTDKEIDYFATFWNGKCYLVPVCQTKTFTLRDNLCRNKHIDCINYMPEYECEVVLAREFNRGHSTIG